MAQPFPPGANWLAKWSIYGGGFLLIFLTAVASALYWSPLETQVNIARNQPIPFSHQRHVEGNGFDCRVCHTSVETSPFAGIPATEICLTCHSQIFANQEMLKPAHDSWKSGIPMEWVRVHDLPDFVYFNHSIHVNKGMGCTTCHGPIGDMRLTYKAETLHMRWCLNCHEEPEKNIRPKSEVFNPNYVQPANQREMGPQLVKEYNIQVQQLKNCSICHR